MHIYSQEKGIKLRQMCISPQDKSFRGEHIADYNSLTRGYRQDRTRPFLQLHSGTTIIMSEHGKFWLYITSFIFWFVVLPWEWSNTDKGCPDSLWNLLMKEFSGGIQDTTGHSSEQPDLIRYGSGGASQFLIYSDCRKTKYVFLRQLSKNKYMEYRSL